MATAAIQSGSGFSALRLLVKPFAVVGSFLVSLAESNQQLRQVEQLNRMTDAELAAKGLKREDIVRHIFGPHMGF